MPIGPALAAARREAGLTVADVSAATSIRAPIVAALEEDDFSRSGGDFYARAHVRAVARAVGLDPAAVVAAYDAEHGPPAAGPLAVDTRGRPDRRGPDWGAAMAVALTAAALYGGAQLVAGAAQPREPTVIGGPVTPPTGAGTAQEVQVRVATPGGAAWVRVEGDDGTEVFEGTVVRGGERSFAAPQELRLVIGNAGAVALTVNGTDIGAPGRSGEVWRGSFTRDDPAAG